MSAARDMGNPLALAASAAQRPRFTFTVPDTERSFPGDPRKVTLQQITVAEEEQAEKTAKGTGKENSVIECLKHSVVAVDGKPLAWADAAKDRFVESLSPKMLRLLLKAFEKLHVPAEEAVNDFLSSMAIEV